MSYQRLMELAARLEQLEIRQRAVPEMKAAKGRPAQQMLAEMKTIVEKKRSE